MSKEIENSFIESAELIKESANLARTISETVKIIVDAINKGNKVITFGNGGSALDAQHIASELIGRFKVERQSIPAIALTSDTSVITSISNDYSFETAFSRQCESLVNEGDVVIGISTSGNSNNVKKGLITAKGKKATTIGLLGNKGGEIKENVDIPIIVDSDITAKIQEVHRVIYHLICEKVEKELV